MNISQIAAFQAVMTSASLSDAARKLGRTQPAVSASIRTLEDQLGLKLFERKGRKLEPVPEAQYLLTETDAILSRLTRVRQTMRSLVDGQAGTLKVAAMLGPVTRLFPKFIAHEIDSSSDITVTLLARTSAQIAELVRAQSIDFGFADAPQDREPENLYTTDIVSADCFLALPKDHPLAAKTAVSVADLHGQPMGSLQSGHALQSDIRELFRAADADLRTVLECQTFLPILQFVQAGQCCAIIDPLTVAHVTQTVGAADGIVLRPIKEHLRYEYAIFAPRYRQVSMLADKLRESWYTEVYSLLNGVGAAPAEEPPDNAGERRRSGAPD
ncbi:LysR family transcriptional regulator [Roseobacter sp. S98]|uniref:LysR family transcriptional regulator n=1 Tax=Roseobacter algicola (ex Choi et al. 2025) (nom. illeg.) TaxID=3092138 RepID=UPI0035C6E2FF